MFYFYCDAKQCRYLLLNRCECIRLGVATSIGKTIPTRVYTHAPSQQVEIAIKNY